MDKVDGLQAPRPNFKKYVIRTFVILIGLDVALLLSGYRLLISERAEPNGYGNTWFYCQYFTGRGMVDATFSSVIEEVDECPVLYRPSRASL